MNVTQLIEHLTAAQAAGLGDCDVVAFDPGDPEAGITPGTWDVAGTISPALAGSIVAPGALVLRLVA